MQDTDIKNKIEDLKQQIRYHDYQYYSLEDPKISDSEYDKLLKELQNLEKTIPNL